MWPSRSPRERVAGQSAMAEVLDAQKSASARSPFARLIGSSPLAPSARQIYRGALGELMVGDLLDNLGSRWDVLHDLALEGGVLDHLVIGPAGVFAVIAANYSEQDVVVDGETLLVGGASVGDIVRACQQADAAASVLSRALGESVPVRALLAIVGARRLVVRRPPRSVELVNSRDLEHFFAHRPQTLSGDQVAAISDVADLETTWPVSGARELDAGRLHREFSIVRNEVSAALLRRVLWGVAAFALAYAVMVTMIATLVTSVVVRR